jgi:NADH-quinone oxidoreductase subunit G
LAGSKISFASSARHEYFFDVDAYIHGTGLVELLAGVAVAAAGRKTLPSTVSELCKNIKANDDQERIARSLSESDEGLVLLGNIASRHNAYSAVRALAACIADLTGAKFGSLSDGANAAGAHLAGLLPHRTQGGQARDTAGLDAGSMLDAKLDAVLLLNVEPDADLTAIKRAVDKLGKQKYVVALSSFDSEALRKSADLILPIGTFAETSGTFVNVAGTWQSFAGIASPVGEARPAWKVLRVLGNLLEVPDFDFITSEDVRDEIAGQLGDVTPNNELASEASISAPNGADAPDLEIDIPLYSVDGLVRRSPALQLTPEAKRGTTGDDAA